MLVVMENGDVAARFQLLLDLEAAGGGDVLQIDPAEGARQQCNGIYNIIYIFAADAEGYGVHSAEFLKEYALALHHRHARLGAYISQAQHSGSVGDHSHSVPAAGQLIALVNIFLYLQTGLGHAGGIGQAQSLPAVHLYPGHHFYFASQLPVQLQGFLGIIHIIYRLSSSQDRPPGRSRIYFRPGCL